MVLTTSNLARSIGNRFKKTLERKLSRNMQPKKSWVNDMVLGCFNPHFNADTRMTSPEAVQDQEKQKYCIYCVFVQSQKVEISIIGIFRRRLKVPRGPEGLPTDYIGSIWSILSASMLSTPLIGCVWLRYFDIFPSLTVSR